MTSTADEAHAWESVQQATFDRATGATRSAWPEESRMSGPEIVEYLDRHRFGVLATGRPDGRPHAVPVAYSRRRSEIWLPTMGGSVRAQNLTGQPWAVLVVSEGDGRTDDDPSGWHRMCTVEGPTELIAAEAAPVELRRQCSWATHLARLAPQRVYTYNGEGD